jgi:hypothetical protein
MEYLIFPTFVLNQSRFLSGVGAFPRFEKKNLTDWEDRLVRMGRQAAPYAPLLRPFQNIFPLSSMLLGTNSENIFPLSSMLLGTNSEAWQS